MKSAQKIKIIPMLLLLWALPMSMLPRVTAKPHATAPAKDKTPLSNEAQLKMTATENYGKLPLSFRMQSGTVRRMQSSFFRVVRATRFF
jgi:hypothetical protein